MVLLILPLFGSSAFGAEVKNPASLGARLLLANKKGNKEQPDPIVIVETNKGTFKIKVFQEKTPITAEHFLRLVEKEFYNGLKFHRYDSNFVIQGGDPTGTGTGGDELNVPLETCPELKHDRAGMVGLARKPSDVNSGSSQFYVLLAPATFLDNDYTLFGEVVEGLEQVWQLRAGDEMEKVYLEAASDKKSSKKK